jgi:hypothetical protein
VGRGLKSFEGHARKNQDFHKGTASYGSGGLQSQEESYRECSHLCKCISNHGQNVGRNMDGKNILIRSQTEMSHETGQRRKGFLSAVLGFELKCLMLVRQVLCHLSPFLL